jgi:hypothetical protein
MIFLALSIEEIVISKVAPTIGIYLFPAGENPAEEVSWDISINCT